MNWKSFADNYIKNNNSKQKNNENEKKIKSKKEINSGNFKTDCYE
ncbi:hypothetical protein JCM19275_3183 [Nonlabens ulvanivorans]|uniref:Uncharacterized protein n=1 Tax=Nonlabens ulvanivorans TaxID=906888 RepID=A0A090WDN1_NONUL|nr:hypothetical protein JCM19275_3183 [Nonlabens ulvanivorans]